jgi:S-DNA-T family DNA segregation ATPase FtsK/SpoIIIE
MDAVPEEYLGAQAGDADSAAAYTAQLVDKLKERLPPPDISARELRERSWWSGPELYLVVDDYDLVVGSTSRGPLAPLADFLAQGRDLGFHVVLARRVGGTGRSLMTDPMLTRLRELGAGGLVLSGDPKEGVLLGDQRAVPRPPGRGVLVRRRRPSVLLQSVLVDEAFDSV